MDPGWRPPGAAQYLAMRSGVPRVVGILAIVFSGIGLIATAIWTFGPLDDVSRWDHAHLWASARVWLIVWGGLSAGVFALHLVAGILAVRYRPSAPRAVTVYAIAAILLAVADLVLVCVLAPDGGAHHHAIHYSVTDMHIAHAILALPWPILALILIHLPASRRSCVIGGR